MKTLKWRALLVAVVISFSTYLLMSRPLNYGIDLQGGTHLEVQVITKGIPENKRDDAVEGVESVLRQRINDVVIAETSIQRVGNDRLVIQIPGVDTEKANFIKSIIEREARLEFKLVVEPSEIL